MFACVAGMFLNIYILPTILHVDLINNCKLGKASNSILGFVLRSQNAGPFSIPLHLVIPKIYTSVCNSDEPVSLEAQFRIVSSVMSEAVILSGQSSRSEITLRNKRRDFDKHLAQALEISSRKLQISAPVRYALGNREFISKLPAIELAKSFAHAATDDGWWWKPKKRLLSDPLQVLSCSQNTSTGLLSRGRMHTNAHAHTHTYTRRARHTHTHARARAHVHQKINIRHTRFF